MITPVATYVAFLRAINLGATRKFPKQAVARATEAAGFTDVATHLNTGNVRFATRMRSRARIEERLEAAYADEAGFAVPTVVLTLAELRGIAEAGRALDHDGGHYVSLLKADPSEAALAKVDAAARAGERAVATGRGVHLLLGPDYHSARLTNALVERHLGVATNRNLNVICTMVDRWG